MAIGGDVTLIPVTNSSVTYDGNTYYVQYPEEDMSRMKKVTEADELIEVLIMLLNRADGKISFSEEEREGIAGHVIYMKEADKAGFTHLHLLPEFVQLGDGEEEKRERLDKLDDELGKQLEELKKYTATTGNWTVPENFLYGSSTTTPNLSIGFDTTPLQQKKPLSPSKLDETWKLLLKDGPKTVKEKKMADTPKAPEQPAPPDGGGVQTTDPTFANQGGQAPKESKPSKKEDIQRKR